MFVFAALLCHALAALAALWLLPGGFPLFHPRFFAHQLAPVLLLATSLALPVLFVLRPRAAAGVLLGYPAAWIGLALGAAQAFPETGGAVVTLSSTMALLLSLGAWLTWKAFGKARRWSVAGAVTGFALGLSLVQCWRAPSPSTVPVANGARPAPPVEGRALGSSVVTLAPWLAVHGREERVDVELGKVLLQVEPMLEFHSRSPDGFWTVFARQPSEPTEAPRAARTGDSLLVWSEAPVRSMSVSPLAPAGARLSAWTEVEGPAYSHLNSFTTVVISGHARLGLRFSPCFDALVEVTYADYPFGAPARFAYLDRQGVFRVVQAADAEKGPFTTLAEGRLGRDRALVVTLVEMGQGPPRALGQIEFTDWSRQLSTELSPTAGFGVAQNAVQFGLSSPHANAPAHLILTLAGTGVGRGWDSVGHRAGLYRNRVSIQPALENASSP